MASGVGPQSFPVRRDDEAGAENDAHASCRTSNGLDVTWPVLVRDAQEHDQSGCAELAGGSTVDGDRCLQSALDDRTHEFTVP